MRHTDTVLIAETNDKVITSARQANLLLSVEAALPCSRGRGREKGGKGGRGGAPACAITTAMWLTQAALLVESSAA